MDERTVSMKNEECRDSKYILLQISRTIAKYNIMYSIYSWIVRGSQKLYDEMRLNDCCFRVMSTLFTIVICLSDVTSTNIEIGTGRLSCSASVCLCTYITN